MKKNRLKRVLLSMVLVVSMVAGMIWLPEGGQAQAADDVMSVTFSKPTTWVGDNGDTSLFMRIVTASDLSSYNGKIYQTTMLVDGKKQLVDWQVGQAGTTWTLYSRLNVTNENYLPVATKSLIIPAGTLFYPISQGAPTLQSKTDFALSGSGSTWTEGFTDAAFTQHWIADSTEGGSASTYVALNLDTNTIATDFSTTYTDGDKFKGTVLIDGVSKTVTWCKGTSGDRVFIYSRCDVDNTNYISAEATRIEIPAGTFFIHASGAKKPVRIAKEIVLTQYGTSDNQWVEGCMDMGLVFTAVYSQTNFLQVQFSYSADLSKITETNPYVYLDTEIDGVVVENVKWVINQSAGKIYPDGTGTTVPANAKSVKIYAGTYSGGYVGSSCKVPIRIKNDIGAMCVANGWYDASTVRSVNASYSAVVGMSNNIPQIQLTTDSVTPDGWKGWFDGTVYVDGEEVKARFYFEPNTQTLYVGQNVGDTDTSDNVMRALKEHKTVKIKAQTELKAVQSQTGPVILNLTEDLILSWNGSEYVQGMPEITTNVSYNKIYIPEGKDAYQLNLTVDNYSDLVNTYGLWSWFEGTIKVNGADRTVAFQLGSDLFASIPTTQNVNAGLPSDTTSFEIPEGTIFTDKDGSYTSSLKIANSLSYVQIDGTWYEKGTEPREITTNVSYRGIITGETAYSLHLTVDNYNDLVTEYGLWSWFEGTIKVNGADRTVAFQLGSNVLATLPTTQNANAGLPLDTTSIEIPAGTIFTDADGSSTNPLKVENRFFYVKVGTAWTTYTSEYEYPDGNNILYYNIDNGSSYTLTSSSGAIEVKELPDLAAGDTISTVGTYNITRVENSVLYKEKVVLYKHGDADESNGIDVRDLVAMRWAMDGTNAEQNARLAGNYAADIDRSGAVDDVDLTALRKALVSEDPAAALSVSKGNSVLNGVMPIAGFSTPIDETYITDNIYQMIAGTGINMIAYCGNDYNNSSSQALAEKQLQLAEKYNLKMYVTDGSVTSQTATDMPAKVGRYSMYHSFLGLHIVDEPEYGGVYVNSSFDRPIDAYTTAINLYNSSANINGYVNLFPYYSDITGATTDNYKEYLTNTFTNTGAEILSYDHYAIRAGANSWFTAWVTGEDFKKTVKEEDFYKNLEMVRAQVKGTGKPFWAYAQTGYPITASGTVSDSVRVTAAEQQWEINAALAMGAKGVQYYQLFQGTDYAGSNNDYRRSGLIGADGQKNTIYFNAAKELNEFIAVIDEVLMNAENKGVIVNDSTASSALSSDVKLSSYKELTGVAGTNAMVGCFDYYGKTALLVVNCNTSSTQDITLNFAESCKAAVTKMGDTAVNRTATSTASVTINVGAGQSALVIIE